MMEGMVEPMEGAGILQSASAPSPAFRLLPDIGQTASQPPHHLSPENPAFFLGAKRYLELGICHIAF